MGPVARSCRNFGMLVWHVIRQKLLFLNYLVGPSGLLSPGKKVADPLTVAQIHNLIDSFANAAVDAQNIGFDGIEIHAAHGYLGDQFFCSATNQRTDEWSGSMANRSRFAGKGSDTRSIDDLIERLDKGEFDLVAVGRALLQDPQWANKIRQGELHKLETYSGEALATLS